MNRSFPRSNVVRLVRCPVCNFHGPEGEPCSMCELIAGEES